MFLLSIAQKNHRKSMRFNWNEIHRCINQSFIFYSLIHDIGRNACHPLSVILSSTGDRFIQFCSFHFFSLFAFRWVFSSVLPRQLSVSYGEIYTICTVRIWIDLCDCECARAFVCVFVCFSLFHFYRICSHWRAIHFSSLFSALRHISGLL